MVLDKAITVLDLAKLIKALLGKDKIRLKPFGQFRVGDIRHAVSDISKLKKIGWRPQDSEENIVKEYIDWVKMQKLDQDYLLLAERQMKKSGIIRKLL